MYKRYDMRDKYLEEEFIEESLKRLQVLQHWIFKINSN